MPTLIANPDSGVCCIKSYVSKRKKRGYVLEGWYVYMIFHDLIFLQKVPTPKFRTHVSYISKRNLLYNRPQSITKATGSRRLAHRVL